MTLTSSRRPAPVRKPSTIRRPSASGMPIESWNSGGAAPVPPSVPSTVTKSGATFASSMAWHSAANSWGWPTHSLKPIGLPPDNSRNCCTNWISSAGDPNAEWRGGDAQSVSQGPSPRPRASAINEVILAAGRMPPCAGLAPWLSLISIILTCSFVAFSLNWSGQKARVPSASIVLPQPKYPVPTFQTTSPPDRWKREMPPSPVLW
mmetsp:Transcript_18546/g.48424  ORF Transcript_18546/g.48424 Transcript_18546/m.48424 type:complete len:206 (+) Transcript_18546:517-1134(+)